MEEKMLNQEDVLEVIEQAADEMDETDGKITGKYYEWSIDTTTVRSLLKRQKEGKLQLPLCQRLYVWNADQRARLLESVELNRPCGVLELSEVDGIQYLVDGLQRLTSLMYLSMDYDEKGLTQEQKKMILDYRIPTIITKDMDATDTKEFFNIFNSGVALAAAVKYRSTLSDELNNAILSLSSNEVFRKTPTKAMFKKGHHHELIVENALLAAAGFDIGGNKAKEICSNLKENEEVVLERIDRAKEIVSRIVSIYGSGIKQDVVTRSFTANFLCTLVYIIAKYDFTDEQYRDLINYIFADKVAIKAYTVTTTNGAADPVKCKHRFDALLLLLNNPPAKLETINEEDFEKWSSEQEIIKDTTGKFVVDFNEFELEDKKALYLAHLNAKAKDWNTVVEKIYRLLEKEDGISEN